MDFSAHENMKISILGCGRWGSFIAWYLNRIGKEVTLWGRENSKSFTELTETRRNEYVLLPQEISLTHDLADAAESADIIIISISAQGLSELMKNIDSAVLASKPVVLCMKGIEADTGRRLSEIASDFTGSNENIAVWVGPGHIQCFTQNIPNCMLIDSSNTALSKMLIDEFGSDLIKFYQGDDIIGSEIGAAAKNVIGIAAGMLDGANLTTLKGALMARGAREVARLIKAMGGNELSAYGLCHLGDYETTLFSPYSNNKRFGEEYIKGNRFTKLAEGVKTADGLLVLSRKYRVELPITKTVSQIVNCGLDSKAALSELFSRSNRAEFY